MIGWLLLAMALGFAAVETAAQGLAKQHWLMSAYSVFHTLVPGELIQTRIFITKYLHPVLWDPVIRSLLELPGWVSLGVPGLYLSWKFRDVSEGDLSGEEGIIHSSYEDILAAAEEFDDHIGGADDLAPSKYGHLDEFNPSRGAEEAKDEPETEPETEREKQ